MRRQPRSTLDRSSAASDVYKRQGPEGFQREGVVAPEIVEAERCRRVRREVGVERQLSLIHIPEPTRPD